MIAPEKAPYRQKEYIQTVQELQSVVSEVPHRGGRYAGLRPFLCGKRVSGTGAGLGQRNPLPGNGKGPENPAITNKLSNTLMVRSAGYFERNFTQKAQKEQFEAFPKTRKVPKGYAIHFNDGKKYLFQK